MLVFGKHGVYFFFSPAISYELTIYSKKRKSMKKNVTNGSANLTFASHQVQGRPTLSLLVTETRHRNESDRKKHESMKQGVEQQDLWLRVVLGIRNMGEGFFFSFVWCEEIRFSEDF